MSVIVYTAILGDCDSLKTAPKGAECICFTDQARLMDLESEMSGWRFFAHSTTGDVRREAWHLRCVPHEIFDGFDISVWVDASFTVTDLPRLLRDSEGHDLCALKHHRRQTCYAEAAEVARIGQAAGDDVMAQMQGYMLQGFSPKALSISCAIVRRNNPSVTAFNELWDAEIRKHPGDNTQLSLDYCAWKTGVGVHHLQGTRHDNPYAVHDAKDHKRRRKPYR